MLKQKNDRPEPKEMFKQVEELVKDTPREIIEQMKDQVEREREVSSFNGAEDLMSKRFG